MTCRLALVLLLAAVSLAGSAPTALAQSGHVPGELLLRFEPDVRAAERAEIRDREGVRFERRVGVRDAEIATVKDGGPVRDVVEALEARDDVAYAEPNYRYRAAGLPDDGRFPEQWALHNTGQIIGGSAGVVDADVDAPEAWDVTTGSPEVTVAVVDTGVAEDHPDLAPNLWRSPGESGDGRERNGRDDDGNGFVDDARGWDFVDADADPDDANGHGTHVASIAGARGGDGAGMAGVSWRSRIMPVRAIDAHGVATAADIAAAFAYAAGQGADVVNASLSGASASRAIAEAIDSARDTLFVVAAGNAGSDLDEDGRSSFPCSYTHDNLVCVAATSNRDELADFSNRGGRTVDLAAPGETVLGAQPAFRTPLVEDFESDPAQRWIVGGSEDPWGQSAEHARSGRHSFTDSPGGEIVHGSRSAAELRTPLDLRGLSRCRLRMHLWSRLENDSSHHFDVQVPGRDGWTPVLQHYEPGEHEVDVPLRDVEGAADARLRLLMWSFDSHRSYDGVFVDDLRVDCVEAAAPATGFAALRGTSMAAPHVAGAAALVRAHRGAIGPLAVKRALLAGVDKSPGLAGRVASGGRLNVRGALDARAPAPVAPVAGTITTIAGAQSRAYVRGDGGPATNTMLDLPWDVDRLADGTLLVVDRIAARVRRILPDGTMSTVAGTNITSSGVSPPDGARAAQVPFPLIVGVAAMPDGSFLLAEPDRVRRVDRDGVLSTVAGAGSSYEPPADGSPAVGARMSPHDLAALPDGSFILSDLSSGRVLRVTKTGRIDLVLGGGTQPFRDGVRGTDVATTHRETVIAPQADGGILVGLGATVLRIAPDGRLRRVAGGREGYDGDGGPATAAALAPVWGLAALPGGEFLLTGGDRVRYVDAAERIWTVAGSAVFGFSGDGGPAAKARLNHPTALRVEADGSFLIVDTRNGRVRRVSHTPREPAPVPPASGPQGERSPSAGGPSVASQPAERTGAASPAPEGASSRPARDNAARKPSARARPWQRPVVRLRTRKSRILGLTVRASRRATLTVRCRGAGCPFQQKRYPSRPRSFSARTLQVTALAGRRLAPGATVTLVVSEPGRPQVLVRYRFRDGAGPTRLSSTGPRTA